MATSKKITVHVPDELLKKAQRSSKLGITETIRKGLELVAAGDAFRRTRALRGKVKFSIELEELRKDRDARD